MNNQIPTTISNKTPDKSGMRIKKLAISGMLAALTVALSGFSIPVGASRCFPIQHLVNVLAGVFLGPVYGVSMAFCTSLIRNLMGTGSLLAFPGSMVGAFLSALLFHKTGKLWLTCLGEIIGTGIIGGVLCYPVAVFLMGKEVAVFFFVAPFLISTLAGTIMAAFILVLLRRLGLFSYFVRLIED